MAGPLATGNSPRAAPIDAQYVVLALDATLTAERVLTGTVNQITLADGGAGGAVTLALPQDYDTGAAPTLGGLTLTGAAVIGANSVVLQPAIDSATFFQVLDADGGVPLLNVDSTDGTVSIVGIADGGLTNYDLKIGDVTTPDYGMIRFGDGVIGRTSYNVAVCDLDGSVVIRNMGTPATSFIEFVFTESGGDAIRFALAKSGVGNATYNPRSMLIAGPAVLDDSIVTVGYWQTQGIFDNLACDTAGDGADLGVQNDLEVEGEIFTDRIEESTTGAGISLAHDPILAKASGRGIKVDLTTPTFGFADLLGDQFSKNTGGTKPTLTTYNGAVDAWQFSDGDEAFLTYHIPHDYVPGTDIHLHVHWSQNNAGATGGTIDFKYFAIYARGHNQASGSVFTSTPITATFSSIDINDGGSGLNQYQHHLTEVIVSAATATAALFDRDDFEPDGVIELTLEMDANNLTGTPSDPFIHYADLHYQTNGIIGTKDKVPDFYA